MKGDTGLVILSEAKDLCILVLDQMQGCLATLRVTMRRASLPLQTAYGLTVSTLREIFDENAYARFLAREKVPASRQSYEIFLREMACRREHRARCC